MSYEESLQAAGARVLAFEHFGSYQGTWYAKVVFNGRTGFVTGSFGSCSGCDSFQAEFGYHENKCSEHSYEYDEKLLNSCVDCQAAKTEYQTKLANFGRGYLDNFLTYDEIMADAKKNSDWDMTSGEMVSWVESHK